MQNNAVIKTKARMRELLDNKAEALERIEVMLDQARAERCKADADRQRAIEVIDTEAFTEAKAAMDKADSMIEMYLSRLDQLRGMDFVTEEESDAVIGSLINYQKERAEEFKDAIADHAEKLKELLDSYMQEHNDALQTAEEWSRNIRSNHMNPNATYKDGTHRSKSAVPVSYIMLQPCKESGALRVFIDSHKRMKSDADNDL